MTNKPGLVGVIAQETARYSYFASALSGTAMPEGSEVGFQYGVDVAANCNVLAERMLSRGEFEWLWLLGDDHTWPVETLTQLLSHKKDIIVPLCLQRSVPYRPVVYTASFDDPRGRARLDLSQHPFGGLIPVHSAGSGGMLIRREVFERMDSPWFEIGKIEPNRLMEDLWFCDKARAVGFEIWCDLDAPFGHLNTSAVWPYRGQEGWTFAFSFANDFHVAMGIEYQEIADRLARNE